MKWKSILKLGVAIVGSQVPAVARVEADTEDLLRKGDPKPSREERLAQARRLVLDSLEASEGIAGKDLLKDAEVARLVDGVSSSIVALLNGLAAKHPAVPASAASLGAPAGSFGD
jgi:hypothetical protein